MHRAMTEPGMGACGLAGQGVDLASCDTLLSNASRPGGGLAAGSWVGAYRIEGPIGVGGTCDVYSARCRDWTRVVLRVPRRATLEFSPRFGERIVETSLWLRHIEHPCLVRVLDYGVTDEAQPRPFQVVEFIDGEPLDAVIAREGARPWRWVVAVVAALATALDCLHRAGYVHCDVKPANVMIIPSEKGPPQVKLLDCDLAWRIGAPKQPGVAPGTPRYIPPENALGVRPTKRTDIYALGVLAVELLLGRCPFGDSDFLGLLRSPGSWPVIGDIANLYADAQRDVDELPTKLRALLRRMTSPQRRRRPASIGECADTLHALLCERRSPPVLVLREAVKLERGPRRPTALAASVAAGLASTTAKGAWPTRGLPPSQPPLTLQAPLKITARTRPWSSLFATVGKVLTGVCLALGLLGAPQEREQPPEEAATLVMVDKLAPLSRSFPRIPDAIPAREVELPMTAAEAERVVREAPANVERRSASHQRPHATNTPQTALTRRPLPRKPMPRQRVPLLDPGFETVAVVAPYICPPQAPEAGEPCTPVDPQPTCIYTSGYGVRAARCIDARWRVDDA